MQNQGQKINQEPLSAQDEIKWSTLIEEWEQGNERQKAYCERLGLNLNTFIYMRSKLFGKKKKQAANKFIEVKIKEEANLAYLSHETIELLSSS